VCGFIIVILVVIIPEQYTAQLGKPTKS